MGYTHYWYKKPELKEAAWNRFAKDVVDIIGAVNRKVGSDIVWESDTPSKQVEINSEVIRFNGAGELGHETFYFERKISAMDLQRHKKVHSNLQEDEVFNFCKTAQKPYDLAVVAVLVAAKHHFGSDIRVSSDGNEDEWQAGVNLVKHELGYGKFPVED